MSFFFEGFDLLKELFSYNRKNYKYDRHQRLKMEYETLDMRIEQVGLWREDIRQFCGLTPKKIENYLLVCALELAFCVMALCKGRVPPGAPPWITACHTVSVCSALMYLFLALWFGMHAFVSAQAYKVRILTQLVRLPIPSWEMLESARTYGSSFEQIGSQQMLRVPFAMGTQESQVPQATRGGSQAQLSEKAESPDAADPWGKEQRADNYSELAPNVNVHTERQKHIWLVREAAKFYQAYDAFCRISMSAGTVCLSVFFAYFTMTYILTEQGAPIMAWAGMALFLTCAQVLLRHDLNITGRQFLNSFLMLASSITMGGLVTFHAAAHGGDPGNWEYLMPPSLVLHGWWHLYYLWIIRVRTVETGAKLPMAFGGVIFVDVFGWARHSGMWWWWKRLRSQLMLARTKSSARMNSFTRFGSRQFSEASINGDESPRRPRQIMRTMSAWLSRGANQSKENLNARDSLRPEDLAKLEAVREQHRAGQALGFGVDAQDNARCNSFRPNSFVNVSGNGDAGNENSAEEVFHTDIHGEKPGVVPWGFFMATSIFIALLWFATAVVNLHNAILGYDTFVEAEYGGFEGSRVLQPVPLLAGKRVPTSWSSFMVHPNGLACEEGHGARFVTTAMAPDGHTHVMRAHLSPDDDGLQFNSAPLCPTLEDKVQDISIVGCETPTGCSAVVLPRRSSNLVSCSLAHGVNQSDIGQLIDPELQLLSGIGQNWLDDRHGARLDDKPNTRGLLQPEQLSSLQVAPCIGKSKADGTRGNNELCVVVGTTAKRIALLQAGKRKDGSSELIPRRLLQSHRDGRLPQPGAFALLGTRYLGVLDRKKSQVRVIDLHHGGSAAGTWRLPTLRKNDGRPRWSSICADKDAIYAMEDAEDPDLWKFPTPAELLQTEVAVRPKHRSALLASMR